MKISLEILGAAIAITASCGCASRNEPKEMLTRDQFAKAVKKCQPMNAKFMEQQGGRPSMEITIPSEQSTVPDCIAKEIEGYDFKHLRINYSRSDKS